MIVDCRQCGTQYRLNEAMFQGARGMQVRCRNCGNSILVLNPGGLASKLAVLRVAVPLREEAADPRRKSCWLSLLTEDPFIHF